MSQIKFDTQLSKIGEQTILKLPKSASSKLPSRGLVMIKGTINKHLFQTPLEPDGKGSHYFKLDSSLLKTIKAKPKDNLNLEIEPIKDWPEPQVPQDLKTALSESSQAEESWKDITPMARWDWIRWIRSTKNPETRKKRILVTLSRFKAGKRRPCCFNRTECTDPYLSHKGMLLESSY